MRLHCLKLVWRNDAADSRYGTSEMPPTAYVRRRLHWLKERTYSCVGSRSLNMNANNYNVAGGKQQVSAPFSWHSHPLNPQAVRNP